MSAAPEPGCTKTCPDASLDCDDLPDGLDPWPAACNPVVFSDGFTDAALSSWLVDHENQPAGVSVPACGRLLFSASAQLTHWIWPQPAVWPPPTLKAGALAEVRFRAPAGHWYVQLFLEAAELSPWFAPQQRFRLCELSSGPDGQAANLRNQVRTAPSAEAILDQKLAVAAGEDLRLQSWITGGRAYCRVSATTFAESSVDAGGLPGVGGLVLAAINPVAGAADLQVEVDWIRVFNHD